MPHLSEPVMADQNGTVKKGPMKVKSVNIRILDDGTFVASVESRDSKGSYESKEYSYEDKKDLADDLINDFLKGTSKKDSYLAESGD